MVAAAGALVYDGTSSRRTLTTAMLDLASRGEIAFREQEKGLLGLGGHKVGVQVTHPRVHDPDVVRARRRPIGRAEEHALERLRSIAAKDGDGYIDPDELLEFGAEVDTFDHRLEAHVVRNGWFRESPSKSTERWSFRGGVEIVVGVVGAFLGFVLPSAGVLLVSGAVIVAGIVTLVLARVMPARTMAGAMIRAMLAAYRRTLQRTMEQARSMKQVVDSRAVPWLETPDQALVWGVALGLQDDVERILKRSVEDARAGADTSSRAWLPAWYVPPGGTSGAGRAGGAQGIAPGLLASSALPDFGGMLSAVGTIGNTPGSSGGSGGFSGGSSGGGGGGAGGGF